jgi:DNA polymerase V
MGDVFYQVKDILERNNVAVFSSNYNLYGDMSRRVMSLLSTYTPKLDIYSIDEAFLDLSGMGDSDHLTIYCKQMVRAITKGTGIPISLGIAPTKTLAKMASKFAKRYKGYQGVCLIDSNEKREKALKLFPVEDVWGIGRKHAKKLAYHGIHTAWDLTQ